MEAWLDKVMVEHTCPDCSGARLRATRLLFTVAGTHHPRRRPAPLRRAARVPRHGQADGPRRRRRPAGAEGDSRPARAAARHRPGLSELQPALGHALGRRVAAHPAVDADRLGPDGHALRARRAEHRPASERQRQDDRDAREPARHRQHRHRRRARRGHDSRRRSHRRDGPGPGRARRHASSSQGTLDDILKCKASPTGQFLSGKRSIATPTTRRKGNGKALVVRGARENNLKTIDVDVSARARSSRSPARRVRARARWSTTSSTRRCGSGWSTRARCRASTTASTGIEHVHKVVSIDQSPIGRNSRSNPATYIGFYDTIRDLFTQAPLSVERDYKPGRFSFNVKGGRCEECQGEGAITTQLYFMPDVEVTCGACKGARFNSRDARGHAPRQDDRRRAEHVGRGGRRRSSPASRRSARKIEVLADLGLGYLTLGQSATTLSGGEAQRIKIATELSTLQRSKHTRLHPRRADDRPAPRRHRAAARVAEPAGRRRPHGDAHRAPPGRDQDGRPRDRPRARRRPRRRRSGRDRHAGGRSRACKASHTGRFLKAHLRSSRQSLT